MKCIICDSTMVNTLGGNWHCPTCGFSLNDLVLRKYNDTITDPSKHKIIDNNVNEADIKLNDDGHSSSRGATGWICPKCGRGLSPWTSECPCYRGDITFTCGTANIIGEQDLRNDKYHEYNAGGSNEWSVSGTIDSNVASMINDKK